MIMHASEHDAFTSIDTVAAALQSKLASLGVQQSRLSHAENLEAVLKENYAAAYSRIAEVDVVEEISLLIRTQIRQKTTAAILAQANQDLLIAVIGSRISGCKIIGQTFDETPFHFLIRQSDHLQS